jgi:hypothetical protein
MKFQAPVGTTHISCAGTEIEVGPDGGFDASEAQSDALLAHGCRIFASSTPWSEAAANAEAGPAPKSRQARSRPSRTPIEKGL